MLIQLHLKACKFELSWFHSLCSPHSRVCFHQTSYRAWSLYQVLLQMHRGVDRVLEQRSLCVPSCHGRCFLQKCLERLPPEPKAHFPILSCHLTRCRFCQTRILPCCSMQYRNLCWSVFIWPWWFHDRQNEGRTGRWRSNKGYGGSILR